MTEKEQLPFTQSEANRDYLLTDNNFNDEHFVEYQKLGGKCLRKEYDHRREVFIDHTHNSYVLGNTSIGVNGEQDHDGFYDYESRPKSCQAVIDELGITDDEFEKLFRSIDNVTAWT